LVVSGIGGSSALGFASLNARATQLQAELTADLQAGQKELEAGKASLSQANTKHDASLVPIATGHFAGARSRFLAASQLADNSRLLHGLEYTPGVGDFAHSRHMAVDGIAGMGVALADAGHELSDLDAQLLKPSGAGQAGLSLLSILDQTSTSVAKVRADLDLAKKAAAFVDVRVVPAGQQSTFVKARATIESAISGLDEFERLVPILKDVLGANGVRTYLIEQVNPAELRAGGGFIGGYSLLQTNQGTLTLTSSGDSYRFADPRPSPGQAGFIPIPTPYREVVPQISWSFVDSNIYPDFESNATAAEGFVQPRLGTRLDGVIAMDYFTVAKMLELTGPIAVPGYGVTVDANNFISVVIQHDLKQDSTNKPLLVAIAGPLLARIATLPSDRWPTLIGALNALAAERHIQAYFNNPHVETEIDRVGWSGSLNPTEAQDYMIEVEDNYIGTKANYFLTRNYAVVLSRIGNTLHHEVVVSFINGTPPRAFDRSDYHVDIRLFVGDRASLGSDNLSPVRYANPGPPAGTKAFDGWLTVACCGAKAQAVFEYDTPWPVRGATNYSIYWQKQPGVTNDGVSVTWNDGKGHAYSASGNLNEDRLIALLPTGLALQAGQPGQATLPSLSLG